jgi:hypothetical protein
MLQCWRHKVVTILLYHDCMYRTCWNNLATSLIISTRLLQIVNRLFQTCWRLVDQLVTRCEMFACVFDICCMITAWRRNGAKTQKGFKSFKTLKNITKCRQNTRISTKQFRRTYLSIRMYFWAIIFQMQSTFVQLYMFGPTYWPRFERAVRYIYGPIDLSCSKTSPHTIGPIRGELAAYANGHEWIFAQQIALVCARLNDYENIVKQYVFTKQTKWYAYSVLGQREAAKWWRMPHSNLAIIKKSKRLE